MKMHFLKVNFRLLSISGCNCLTNRRIFCNWLRNIVLPIAYKHWDSWNIYSSLKFSIFVEIITSNLKLCWNNFYCLSQWFLVAKLPVAIHQVHFCKELLLKNVIQSTGINILNLAWFATMNTVPWIWASVIWINSDDWR